MARRSYRKSESLFHEGDPGDTMHLVDKGHVAIRTTTAAGDVATLAVLGAGAWFGEQALIASPARRTASAVALDAVETRALGRAEFERPRAAQPAVERFLVHALASQVRRLSEQLVEALFVPADKRVVRRLNEVAVLYDDGTGRLDVTLRQEDLASMAGTTRPTTNRVLEQLEADGMIVVRRGGVFVVDATGLRARAR